MNFSSIRVSPRSTSELNSGVCDVQSNLESPVPYADPEKWRHHVITMSPAQRKELERCARSEGLSNRAYVDLILSAWLRKPTVVQPVHASPNRTKLKINIRSKVYDRLSEYALAHHVTRTAVTYTAIARQLGI